MFSLTEQLIERKVIMKSNTDNRVGDLLPVLYAHLNLFFKWIPWSNYRGLNFTDVQMNIPYCIKMQNQPDAHTRNKDKFCEVITYINIQSITCLKNSYVNSCVSYITSFFRAIQVMSILISKMKIKYWLTTWSTEDFTTNECHAKKILLYIIKVEN